MRLLALLPEHRELHDGRGVRPEGCARVHQSDWAADQSPGIGGDVTQMKLWGGRFESGPSEVFERFSESLHFDKRLADVDIRGSQAYARALERVGILTAGERGQLANAAEHMREEGRPRRV